MAINMYSFTGRVRYSEINREGILDIPSVLNYFQDCSTFQSEHIGLGVEHLRKAGRVWVLNSWQMEFLEPAKLLDEIKISTWCHGTKGVYAYRNFVMDRGNTRLVNANSIWVFTDMETGAPVKAEEKDLLPYGIEPPIEMKDYGRKIKLPDVFGWKEISAADSASDEVNPDAERVSDKKLHHAEQVLDRENGKIKSEKMNEFSVRKYHIDTNGHVNNAKYVQFAMEYLPEEYRVRVLRAEYRKSAKYGDVIYPAVFREDGRLTVSLQDKNENVYANVQFIYT